MNKFILLLTFITSINLTANPFNSLHVNTQQVNNEVSTKFMYAKRAAAQGNSRALFDLGLMYATGQGVRKNERLAFNYFHKAARKNHSEAKFYVGLSFSQGRGVRQQTQLARYWFKLAAKSGHPKAMAHLASIEKVLRPQYGRNGRIAFNMNN